jgi:tape measure domain-containing protein
VAVATVDIQVNSQGAVSALRQTAAASKQLESAVGGATSNLNNQKAATGAAASQLSGYSKTTQAATAATNGLKGAVGGLLGAFTAISAAKFVFAKTAELESQTKSLEVLTGSTAKAKAIIQELQQLGAVTPFTSTELIDSAKRLNAFGVEGDKVVDTTRRLADVAGATGAELNGLVTAYGQVQAKGRLQGEELLQFQERGVALQDELRKMYGLSGEEFQKALSKGRISAEAVEVAVKRLTDTGGKYANGAIVQSNTLQGKFSTLTDSVENLARTVGTVFAPLFKWLLTEATNVINVITDAINMAAQGPQKAQVIAQIRAGKIPTASMNPVDYLTGNTTNNKLLEILGNGNLAAGDKILKQLARQSSKGPGYLSDPNKLIKLLQQQPGIKAPTAPTVATTNPPPLLAATGETKKSGSKAAETAAKRAAEEAARLAEETKKQLDSANKLNDIAAANLDIQVSMNDAERLQGEFDKAAIERRMQFLELQKNAKSQQERELLASAQLSEVLIANNKYAKDKKALLDQQLKPLEDIITANKTKLEDDQAYQRLLAEGINPELAKQFIEIDRAGKALQESLQPSIDLAKAAVLEAEARGASADEVARLKKELEDLQKLPGQKVDEAKKGAEALTPSSKGEAGKIEDRVKALKKEIADLTSLSTIAITAADGIGTAFGNSFKSLIDGSMTAREALSGFFKDVASMFLEMAAQIIAKQITMIILQTILKALGAVAGASGGFGAGGDSFNANGALPAGTGTIPSLGSSYGFANGGAFANGIRAFASGGIVGSPTLFQFANGGTTQTGLMGEAGPEAIMPLSRGAGGKLGVNASGLREAMGGTPGMGGSPVLNMSFETTRFGDTDYVSRDQLEAAMAQTRKQASSDGAKRGMNMTLDRLQQSPQTRNRVGLR